MASESLPVSQADDHPAVHRYSDWSPDRWATRRHPFYWPQIFDCPLDHRLLWWCRCTDGFQSRPLVRGDDWPYHRRICYRRSLCPGPCLPRRERAQARERRHRLLLSGLSMEVTLTLVPNADDVFSAVYHNWHPNCQSDQLWHRENQQHSLMANSHGHWLLVRHRARHRYHLLPRDTPSRLPQRKDRPRHHQHCQVLRRV